MKFTNVIVLIVCLIKINIIWAVNPDFVITKLLCVDRNEDMCIDLICNLRQRTSKISQIEIGCMLGYPLHKVYVAVDLSYTHQNQQYSLLRFNDFNFCDEMKSNWTSKMIVKILDQHFNIHNCPYIGRIKLENYSVLTKFEDGRLKTGQFQLYIRVYDDKNRTVISPVLFGRLLLPRAMQMLTELV